MAGFFARLFGVSGPAKCRLVGHWCESPLTFSNKIETPLGSKVSKVKVCVDIWYSVSAGEIMIEQVQLSQGRSSLGEIAINVATMKGEAFFASSICDAQLLKLAVEHDLEDSKVGLKKRMIANWRSANPEMAAISLADALNAQQSPDEIAALIASGGRNEIVFTYTKTNGESATRHVTVESVSGDSIRALDHTDDNVKSFRIDRITNARKA